MQILSKALTTSVFIRSVSTIPLTVTEQATFNTLTVSAGEWVLRAEGLIGVQQWLNLALLVLNLAIPDGLLPIACLFLNIEVQTGWTTDSLKTLNGGCRNLFIDFVFQNYFQDHTDEVHWITSRQLSPSPATKRNHSPASLSLHNSCSKDSSFFGSSCACTTAVNNEERREESEQTETEISHWQRAKLTS